MKPDRIDDYLKHIAEAIERATHYLEPVPDLRRVREEYAGSGCCCPQHRGYRRSRQQYSAHRPRLQPQLPWAQMRAMRNVMIHEYFFIDLGTAWTTVKDDFPKLKQQIDRLLIDLKPDRER